MHANRQVKCFCLCIILCILIGHVASGEFGSERLVQKVVDTILRLTAKKVDQSSSASNALPSGESNMETTSVAARMPEQQQQQHMDVDVTESNVAAQNGIPMKIILEGQQVRHCLQPS